VKLSFRFFLLCFRRGGSEKKAQLNDHAVFMFLPVTTGLSGLGCLVCLVNSLKHDFWHQHVEAMKIVAI
jgi:hypothetical protein